MELSSWALALAIASVSFDEALTAATLGPRAAGLERARLAQEARQGDLSGVGGNPTITVSPGVHLVEGGQRDPAVQLNVTQAFQLSGLGSARRAASRAEIAWLGALRESAGLESSLEAAASWLEARARERTLEAAREEAALSARLVALIERGVQGGGLTRIELSEARAYRGEARLAALRAEGEVFEAEVALARAIHVDTATAVKTRGPLPSFTLTADERALSARIDALPQVRLERLHGETLALRTRELEAEQGTSFFAGLSGQMDSPREGFGFVSVGATLPVFERGQRARATSEAESARQTGVVAATRREMVALVARALHEVEHTREVRALLADELVPALLDSAELLERALGQGEATVPDLLRARRALTAGRARLHRAEVEHAAALVRVRLLFAATGGSDDRS